MNFHNPPPEPAFNAPATVLGMIGAFALVHAVRAFLPEQSDIDILVLFAFIPARYAGDAAMGGFPGGLGADLWTFVSYAFLHGNLTHLAMNAIWFLVFASPVAWRFGTKRFLLFCGVTAVAGAVAHLVSHWGEFVPVIGASGIVSGVTAAAIRFVFGRGGPLRAFGRDLPVHHAPAAPLRVAFRDPSVLTFVIIWFALNLVFGAFGGGVAWQAHVGGFVAGLFLFPLFDPPRRRDGYLRAA